MRNIFVEKPYIKWGGETIPRPFFRKLRLNIVLDQNSEVLYSLVFLLHANLRAIEKKWNQATDHLLLPYVKLFQKIKRGLQLDSLP